MEGSKTSYSARFLVLSVLSENQNGEDIKVIFALKVCNLWNLSLFANEFGLHNWSKEAKYFCTLIKDRAAEV